MSPRPAVGLALILVAAGLAVSRPLPSELTGGLPVTARAPADVPVLGRTAGDTLQLYYQLWLFRDGLFGPTPLFRDPYQFRIGRPRWNLPQTFPPLALPFTLLGVFGARAAYNLLVLLSFPLTGLAAYGLVRYYTGHAPGAVVAGLAFALVPARLGPLFGGQPAGFAAGFVPVVFWGLDVALARGRLWGGLAGGAALAALATIEPHYTYLVAALLVVYTPLRWLTLRDRRIHPIPCVAFGALAAGGAGWLLMLRQAFVVGSIADAGRSLDEVRLFSPGPAALLTTAAYGGLALFLLALVGLAAPRRRDDGGLRLFYGLALAGGLILSLGPTVPAVPLYRALHRWVPLFAMIRNPDKFRILVTLGAAVLAGYGVRALLDRCGPRAARAVGVAIAAVVLVETPPWHAAGVALFPDNPVYATLRREAREILYLPVWPGDSAWSSVYLYTVTRTRVPMVNGYSPLVPRRYGSEVYAPLRELNVGDLGPDADALLRRLGVTHVVVDRSVFPSQVSPFPSAFTLARLRASPSLVLEEGADPLWVLRVTDRPPRPTSSLPTSPVGVFYEAESLPRETGLVVEEPGASGGHAVAARAGAAPPGFLTFGPYRLLPAGAYRATFRTRGRGLVAEVTTDRGRRILAERAIAPSTTWVDTPFRFALDHAGLIELRVRWDGQGEAAVDWILVVFADRPEPEWRFEVEALPHRLGERPDPAASGGWAGYADPAESQRTDLVSGPARLYPAGRYRLLLRARAQTAVRGPLLRLAVAEPAGPILAARTVDGIELSPGGYREVGLDFALAQPTVVEFPIGYLGGTGVFFDRVDVTSTGDPGDSSRVQ